MKKIVLATICPEKIDIQLALYNLKTYLLKYSTKYKPSDIPIEVFDKKANYNNIINTIMKYEPMIIGFSCYVWNIEKILEISEVIKKNYPDTKIILGGPEASPRAIEIIKRYRFIDIVVIGEGERTFKETIDGLLVNKGKLKTVCGIAYRRKQEIVITKKRLPMKDLDEIPSPYLEKVISLKQIKSLNGHIPTQTARGCTYRCHYCYYHQDSRSLRCYSLDRVESELAYLLKNKPYGIYLMDATFNIDKIRAKEILRIFIRHNLKSKLHLELRAELLDEELIDLLKKAKTSCIEIGLQSMHKETLNKINRKYDFVSFKKNLLLLNKKKIPYELQVIDSLPQETYLTLKESIDWMLEFKPYSITIMRLMLLPGTYLREHAENFGIKYNNRPPYLSKRSSTFSEQDIKKTSGIRWALNICYENKLLKNSIYIIKEQLGISFCDILQAWQEWMSKQKGNLYHRYGNTKIINKERMSFVLGVLDMANSNLNFVKNLYKKQKKDYDNKVLSKALKKDRNLFLKNCNFTERVISK